MQRLAGDVGDGKAPENVRLTPESGENLPVQIGRQWDRGCIFVGLRADCAQRLVRRSLCQDVPHVLLQDIVVRYDRADAMLRSLRSRNRTNTSAGIALSSTRKPTEQEQQIKTLYRTRYRGFTAKHFHEHLVRDHGFSWGYSWTKVFLQSKGLLSREDARRAPPQAATPAVAGMMLHQSLPPDAARALCQIRREGAQYPDGSHAIFHGPRCIGRYDEHGALRTVAMDFGRTHSKSRVNFLDHRIKSGGRSATRRLHRLRGAELHARARAPQARHRLPGKHANEAELLAELDHPDIPIT